MRMNEGRMGEKMRIPPSEFHPKLREEEWRRGRREEGRRKRVGVRGAWKIK